MAEEDEEITLAIGEARYDGWLEIAITRSLNQMAGNFSIGVTEGWTNGDTFEANTAWQIKVFDACRVYVGRDLVLTGYVDDYNPAFSARDHKVAVAGRSKTMDIVDCMPDLKGGQFTGYKLDQIARAVAQPFGVDVDVQVDVGAPFPDATMERTETGFAFLERLARQRRVLLTDDAQGRLVIARAGSKRASDSLVQGGNILRATARLSGRGRFSEYRVKGQTGENHAPAQSGLSVNLPGGGTATLGRQAAVVVDGQGVAKDDGVPRYRPFVLMAESALDATKKQERAEWQMRHNRGKGTETHITVQGWRQRNGALWDVNHLCRVRAPWLALDEELLISSVTYRLDGREGRRTDLVLTPVDAFAPEPISPRGGPGGQGPAAGLNARDLSGNPVVLRRGGGVAGGVSAEEVDGGEFQ